MVKNISKWAIDQISPTYFQKSHVPASCESDFLSGLARIAVFLTDIFNRENALGWTESQEEDLRSLLRRLTLHTQVGFTELAKAFFLTTEGGSTAVRQLEELFTSRKLEKNCCPILSTPFPGNIAQTTVGIEFYVSGGQMKKHWHYLHRLYFTI